MLKTGDNLDNTDNKPNVDNKPDSELKPTKMFIKAREVIAFRNPGKIATYCCEFDKEHFHENLFHQLGIQRPSALNKAVVKRQAEFLAGRYAAATALGKLGINATHIPIGNHRSPVWPKGVNGSITHTNNTALSVVGLSQYITFLGVDREDWIKPDTVEQVKEIVIKGSEEKRLRQNSIDFNKALTLTFSAKECLFKALYPNTGFYFDFTAAEITQISPESKRFELTLVEDLTEDLTAGCRFDGQFVLEKNSVTTLIAI
ncbi:4'-phosphopantetheinyl transferase family protein [Aliikangiella coralliicola]|uniref:Enterobactin synthase component D n=1 Tax=Aliikangiella coralliicola TaxID=2592383 RepID=A0A545UD71_9GAMM|nr:4'-phosphopantetheinyl transferase superfamily protein [Aliikangiella coralliicola]TQV87405.1 4'-phosphopantetheinyl transferase superfamily protein [Aliikangiella coralliicola]